jgi:CyaY protein
MLSESEYVDLAHAELLRLVTSLDRIETDDLECELENDILTLELPGDTTYVINSHRAARQIWMAAERTAWHFDWEPKSGAWVATKTGDELWATVRRVLSPRLGSHLVDAALTKDPS